MAEIDKERVLKIDSMSIVAFIAAYHPNLTPQAINYAIANDKVDYTQIGSERLIVMTEKTKQYVPNESKKREDKATPLKRKKRTIMNL